MLIFLFSYRFFVSKKKLVLHCKGSHFTGIFLILRELVNYIITIKNLKLL